MPTLATLTPDGLMRYRNLELKAVMAVTDRFYATHGSAYQRFGQAGREACKQDLAFHLEFLRPVLEFGLTQSMVAYLRWLQSVLSARGIPANHLEVSLDWLGEFFVENMDVADSAVINAALHSVKTEFHGTSSEVSDAHVAPDAWPEASLFKAALLAGNQREALEIMDQCLNSGKDFLGFELHVIQPALYWIGELWQANQASVAQEHLATAIVHAVMTVGLVRSPPKSLNGKRVLLACVEGNQHAVGLRIVADSFMLSGWDVQYLGANVPTRALVQQVEQWRPNLVGLSVSFAHQLPVVKSIIQQLSDRLGNAKPAVTIGGLAINRFAPLAEFVGADFHGANAQAAVLKADAMIESQSDRQESAP